MNAAAAPLAPRCWLEKALSPGPVELTASERRHLEKVRRLRPGNAVCVLNGIGQIGQGRLVDSGTVEIEAVENAPRPIPDLRLMMGAVKHSAWEEILRHATELGVSTIVRVECTHSVSRLDGNVSKKLGRWEDLLLEACKQSANPWRPELKMAASVQEAVDTGYGSGVVAQLEEDARSIQEALPQELPDSLAVWVGPEGDFTAEEYQLIRGSGAVPVTLGPRILRAETAALSLLSRLRLHS